MNNYSISYMDAHGRTVSSQYLPFKDNGAAVAYARIGLTSNAIVEVWRDNQLVTRLKQAILYDPGIARGDLARLAARRRFEQDVPLAEWDDQVSDAPAMPRERDAG